MKVYLIRHGMTPGNREHRYVGRTDEGLTEQACQALREKRTCFPMVDWIVSSPMKRCVQTAKILFPEQSIELCSDLKEMDFGAFEYKNYKELSGNPEYQAWIDSNGTLPFPAGEDVETFKDRCRKSFQECLNTIRKQQKRRTNVEMFGNMGGNVSDRTKFEDADISVAFVVHGGTIMAILEAFAEEKKGYYDWQVKNGCGYQAYAQMEDAAVILKEIVAIGE